ncbi:MAG: hypothetical protein K0R67_1770, partial [Paenibacillus sp.]|nr:hypothetical protein [Paenibacillus sp.]
MSGTQVKYELLATAGSLEEL